MGMRIAITGASGFIGRELVKRARDAGHTVVPLSRSETSVTSYEDAPSLTQAFEGCDVVVHLAARAHLRGTDADFEGNVRAARAVAQAAKAAEARRLVLLSSIGVNGNLTRSHAFSESDPPAPAAPYARSKLLAEREVQAGGIESVIVRPPLVHGANAPGNFARLVHAVASGWPLPLASVRNRRSMVGVHNLCDFILACAVHPAAANELFLIADGEDLSTPEIIACLARGLRKRARLWPAPPALLVAAATLIGRRRTAEGVCESLQVDPSKAGRVLGWKPAIGMREGIEQAARDWSFP